MNIIDTRSSQAINVADLADYPAITQIASALWGTSEIRGAAVMVGAGFSRMAELPATNSHPPPLWRDFHKAMAVALYPTNADVAPSNPLRLAEEYRAVYGPSGMQTLVRSLVKDTQWQPGNAHRTLMRLPWTDILTTNWDTLLERNADPESERTYEAVLTVGDIARTRAPRIVKLHGTFPSLSPFVFTEEDYRSYPATFAPFINLAQQVLLENELCLLGFSGDDPNFLAWSGWVRDNLRDAARRIHLIGVLDLPPSHRRMLEQRNISVVDLAPLVAHEDESDRHRLAAERFLEALHAAKPSAPWIWTVREANESTGVQTIEELVKRWQAERESYPGWVVAPYVERYELRVDLDDRLSWIVHALPSLTAPVRARLLIELTWRCITSLADLPVPLIGPLEEVFSDPLSPISNSQRVGIAEVLLRHYREEHNRVNFDTTFENASVFATSDEDKSRLAYEKCLWARGQLDYPTMASHVAQIDASDPVWAFRRARILCLLGRSREAVKLVRIAHTEIKLRRLRDKHSVWLLSRQAWAQFIIRNAWLDDSSEDKYDFVQWPPIYAEAKCDPWDELQHLRSRVDEESNREGDFERREVPLYDPGFHRTKTGGRGRVAGFVISPYNELLRFHDYTGLAEFRGSNAGAILERAAKLLEVGKPEATWATALAISRRDGLIDERFNRISVALLDADTVRKLAGQLKAAIEYGRQRLWDGPPDEDGNRRSTIWVERIPLQLELLSRLVVRLDNAEAEEYFKWGIQLAQQADWVHWWLFESHANMLERSFSTMSPGQRAGLAEDIINFPLYGEKSSRGNERHWPELAEKLMAVSTLIVRPPGKWDVRIAQLIQRARETEDRTRALIRLLVLSRAEVLTDDERSALDAAVWSKSNQQGLLPGGAELRPFAWLELAANDYSRVVAAFVHDVVQPLREGEIWDAAALSSLSVAVERNSDKGNVIIDTNASLEIANHLVKWRPKKIEGDGYFASEQKELAFYCSDALARAILPSLPADAYTEDLYDSFLEATRDDAVPELVLAAPYFAINRPDNSGEILRIIRRAMISRDRGVASLGLQAVELWAKFAREDTLPFPAILASDAATLCGARHDTSLHAALRTCNKLITSGQIDEPDIERLEQALDLMLVDTAYENQSGTHLNAVTLTLVRAECVRMAARLLRLGRSARSLRTWADLCASDPLPEVRMALLGNGVDD
ncbi:hypothetical protein GOB50_30950 [Sinorhizobium meliloti]|nr:hypothetical protein [Sinorhizobium meliloti]